MAAKPRITLVVGARPNFMKAAPLAKALAVDGRFATRLVHTGQHFDENMSKVFFEELGLPEPDAFLNVNTGTPNAQIATIMLELEKNLKSHPADLVVVFGDVNSTLAAAVVANKMEIRLAHVEAGLRSYDSSMPEEYNRIVTDHLADLLFTPSPDANDNLLREGVSPDRIYLVGNIMVDSLLDFRNAAVNRDTFTGLGVQRNEYALVTLHRQANVDNPDVLKNILAALSGIGATLPVLFPMHPRTRQRIQDFGLKVQAGGEHIQFLEPLSYVDFMNLMINSRMVLTDSGGIQEETTVLGVPCLTLRDNTERPITVSQGTNRLVGVQSERIIAEAKRVVGDPLPMPAAIELWDGKTAERIVEILGRKMDLV